MSEAEKVVLLQRELMAAFLFLHEMSHAPHMRKEHGARLERYAIGLGKTLDTLKLATR